MEQFTPYEKLSKKEKRKIDKARRQTWGELNPVTRKPENSKAYNRNKTRDSTHFLCQYNGYSQCLNYNVTKQTRPTRTGLLPL